MTPLGLSLVPTIANVSSRLAHLVFIISIGIYFGISSETDAVFLLYAPLAVLLSITVSVNDVVVVPLLHRTENIVRDDLIITRLLQMGLYLIPVSAVVIALTCWVNQMFSISLFLFLLPIGALNATSSILSGYLCAKNNVASSLLGPLYGAILALLLLSLRILEANAIGLCFTLLVYEIGRCCGLYAHSRVKLSGGRIGEKANQLLGKAYANAKMQLVGAALIALNPMVDIYFASLLNAGDSTSIEYVGRFWNMIYVFFVGYLAVFYTRLSREASSGKVEHKKINRKALHIGIIASLISLVGILFSPTVIDVFYALGGPDENQKQVLAKLLQLYLIGTGPYIAGMLYVRALSALDGVSVLTKIAAIYLISNILFNYLFIQYFQVNGIALATSVANCISLGLFYLYFNRHIVVAN